MITRTTQVTLMKEDGRTFDEDNWVVSIDDEGSGEFVIVRNQCDEPSELRIDPKEWPTLREAIDTMIGSCKPEVN
jgi:hypothetical protein